jgi:hypothetical protein
VPCVTTRFTDEVDGWTDAARVATGEAEFIAACGALLSTPTDPEPLLGFARRHDWDEIAATFVRFALEDAV